MYELSAWIRISISLNGIIILIKNTLFPLLTWQYKLSSLWILSQKWLVYQFHPFSPLLDSYSGSHYTSFMLLYTLEKSHFLQVPWCGSPFNMKWIDLDSLSILFWWVLRIKPSACILGKCSTTKQQPQLEKSISAQIIHVSIFSCLRGYFLS